MAIRYHKMIWKGYQKNRTINAYASGGGENMVSKGDR